MATKKPKGDIFGKSKELIKKGTAGTKKYYVGKVKPAWKTFAKGATTEQVFLGKTLPTALWKTAKWGFKHPIASTALLFAPKLFKKKQVKLASKSDPFGITRSRKKFPL